MNEFTEAELVSLFAALVFINYHVLSLPIRYSNIAVISEIIFSDGVYCFHSSTLHLSPVFQFTGHIILF